MLDEVNLVKILGAYNRHVTHFNIGLLNSCSNTSLRS